MLTYFFLLLQVLFKHLYSYSIMETLCSIFNGKVLLKDMFFRKDYLKWDVLLERSEAGLSFFIRLTVNFYFINQQETVNLIVSPSADL